MPSQPKLQRWTDLLAALLRRSFPVDFSTLRYEVPAYSEAGRSDATTLRMFERDKDDLRLLGVPIESVADDDGNVSRYRLAARQFYLPYLHLALEQPARIARPRGPGYQGLAVLAFEPEELDAVARAAQRVAALGDPALAHEARVAVRKLGHDLPIAASSDRSEYIVLDHVPSSAVLDLINDALRRRKVLTFTYWSMHRDATSTRTVEPYGLAFLSGHWYLIGRDSDADARRQFRVSRIEHVAVNPQRSQTADFEIPADFELATYATSRQAWEIGDADEQDVDVDFLVENGHTLPAMQLGTPVAGFPARRRFRVRRLDSFVLWVLGYAGDARIVTPPDAKARFARLARETLTQYAP
jgi:predicted DNA-binding transcriptional regulator YafY